MSHTYSSNLAHCVFSTKGRTNLIPEPIQEKLYAYMFGIARNLEIEILALGGVANHVHILLALPATKTLSNAIRDLPLDEAKPKDLCMAGGIRCV
jgi:putative transposase